MPRLSVRTSSSCSSSVMASVSSAHRCLVLVLPLMLTFPSGSSRASDNPFEKKKLKIVGESKQENESAVVYI